MNNDEADKAIKNLEKIWEDTNSVKKYILDTDSGTLFATNIVKSIEDSMNEIHVAKCLVKSYKYALNYKPENNE